MVNSSVTGGADGLSGSVSANVTVSSSSPGLPGRVLMWLCAGGITPGGGAAWATGWLGTTHPGQSTEFWVKAAEEGRPRANERLKRVLAGKSKVGDAQAGHEKTLTGLLAALAGVNVVYGLGMLESGVTIDFGQLVMDNEFAGMIKHVLKGIPVDDENLAEMSFTTSDRSRIFWPRSTPSNI